MQGPNPRLCIDESTLSEPILTWAMQLQHPTIVTATTMVSHFKNKHAFSKFPARPAFDVKENNKCGHATDHASVGVNSLNYNI